ncbi:MAG: formimidoylglutamate deiminase [Marivirga sp.]|nr:formimidoylglutamate deiminase [Marivirga sp.]
MKHYKFNALIQDNGWLNPAYVSVDHSGIIQYLSDKPFTNTSAIEFVNGFVLPGFQNSHSHAFQFAMAGMAEKHSPGSSDDFWSWREAMYQCALGINPDQLEHIASMLYAEMLRNGYTHVAEFHYLHHDASGKPYSNLAEMGERLIAAAARAGIKITLIPVFYQKGNFGKEPQERQRRFISKTIDDYFHLLDDSATAVGNRRDALLGFGVHSLRAVEHTEIIKTFQQGPATIPFHLHAAEQLKEIEDCQIYLKKRPVEWLLENLPLNERFHLVHCTHMNETEIAALASTKANVVLCPGTEGNLGDGIFNLTSYLTSGGKWAIGTDSHISLNPLEDLRWMDYAQRLTTHKRNTFDDGAHKLIQSALNSGRKAMANKPPANFFEIGNAMDAVVYDGNSPLLLRPGSEHVLPSIVYTADSSWILGTMVNGKWVVKNHRHLGYDQIKPKYLQAIKSLKN